MVGHLVYTGADKSTFPKKEDTFASFYACPFDQVKVVIVGQDPYPGRINQSDSMPGHADGMCFSSSYMAVKDKFPDSLFNVFKELTTEGFSVPATK